MAKNLLRVRTGCVYVIRNLVNDKIYVGQHIDVTTVERRRWAAHIRAAYAGVRHPLYCAMRKHGVYNFSAEVIWTGSTDALNTKEQFYVRKLNALIDSGHGYNLTLGGESGARSDASVCNMRRAALKRFTNNSERAKASAAQRERFSNSEERKKISESLRGKRHSEETRKRMSISQKLRYLNHPEHKEAVSKAQRGRPRAPISEATRQKMRAASKLRMSDPAARLKISISVKKYAQERRLYAT